VTFSNFRILKVQNMMEMWKTIRKVKENQLNQSTLRDWCTIHKQKIQSG